jgi:hypothetical protein
MEVFQRELARLGALPLRIKAGLLAGFVAVVAALGWGVTATRDVRVALFS